MVDILNDDKLRKEMGEKGREFVIKNFSNENIVNKYIDIYKKMKKKSKS